MLPIKGRREKSMKGERDREIKETEVQGPKKEMWN